MTAQEGIVENTVSKPIETNVLLTWKSPSRPFKKRDKEYFTTIGAIVFLIAVILLLLKEVLLIGVILSLMFIAYVLSTTEPETVEHSISTVGFTSMGRTYQWDQLRSFWFSEKWGKSLLTISFALRPTSRLLILVPLELQDKVKTEFSKYLAFQEVPERNFFDNAAEWLSKKIPLENS